LGIVEKSIALRTVHMIVAAPSGGKLRVPRNVRVDFPYASTVVATGLKTRREPRINVNVEDQCGTIVGNFTGTHGHRPNAFGTFVSIEAIVRFGTLVVVVTAIGFIFGDKAFAGTFGTVFLGRSRLDTMAMIVQFSNQTIVSSRLTTRIVLMHMMVSNEQIPGHYHNRNHDEKDDDFDENVEYKRSAQSYMVSPQIFR
jgi:hypothetical protein